MLRSEAAVGGAIRLSTVTVRDPLLDCTPIIPATACHQRNYVETYSRYNQYFKEFATLTVSVDKALAYFATHPDTVLGLFGLYCEESGLELKQAA
jgi:hypothetical protein